jgi:head-tail adaptor
MQAGLLKDIIDIYKPTSITNDYGEQIVEYVKTHTIRARVIHSLGTRTIINNELIYPYNKTFIVRIYNDIKEGDEIRFDSKRFRVISIESNKELQ